MTLPVGASTAAFSVTAASSIASNQVAPVTATFGSTSQTAMVSLLAPVLVSGVACPTSLGQGAVGTCTVSLSQTRRRIERDAGEQQSIAHRTGVGHGSGGSDDGDVQRYGGGFDSEQSDGDGDRDVWAAVRRPRV